MTNENEAFDVEGLNKAREHSVAACDYSAGCACRDAKAYIEALEKRVRELEGAIKYASKNCIADDGHTEESCGTELTYLEIESSDWVKHQRAIQKLRKLIQKEPT